jgi:hypothetical protein
MLFLTLVVRRSFGWCRGVVESIRHGEDDMRAIYGDHPNGQQSPEQTALQASVTMNISHLTSGGLGQ